MTREQTLEAALRFVHDDSGFRDLEPHTLVAVLNALATPPDADTRVVSVEMLGLMIRELNSVMGDEYSDSEKIDKVAGALRAIIEGKDQ